MTDVAKSSKGKTDKPEIDDAVEDAVEVEMVDAAEESDEAEATAPEPSDDVSADDIPDDEDALTVAEEDISEVETLEDPLSPETPPEPAAAPAQSGGGTGLLTLLLGGVAAGAIGYLIATYGPGERQDMATAADVSAQSDRIDALQQLINDTPAPDISALEAQIAAVSEEATATVDGALAGLTEQFDSLETRLSELERQPLSDGTLSETALAAYQSELDELRAELDAQQEAVMSAASQAEADLAAAREEAQRLEQEALAAAEAAAARAAINRIAAAVETGAPFGDALADLDGADIPAGLADAAADGVATNAALVADFPAAARSALATARAEGVSDDAGGIGGFLRSQFDVRSTTPQEGSGPDAVLSRAEAAIKEGRVADALAELNALPEVARAEMTDWTAAAQARSDVLDAIASLSETYQ